MLPTHLCLPVCESPLLTCSLIPLHVLTCPPICAFQFVSPPCSLHILTYPPICAFQFVSPPYLLHVLTYPLICAIQFVSPPHLLTHSAPCPDLPIHLCLPVCESPLLTHSLILLLAHPSVPSSLWVPLAHSLAPCPDFPIYLSFPVC